MKDRTQYWRDWYVANRRGRFRPRTDAHRAADRRWSAKNRAAKKVASVLGVPISEARAMLGEAQP